jgi:hypothetical protein
MCSASRPTHLHQQFLDPLSQALAPQISVGHDGLGHDGRDVHARVERGKGVLEDHLHFAAELA